MLLELSIINLWDGNKNKLATLTSTGLNLEVQYGSKFFAEPCIDDYSHIGVLICSLGIEICGNYDLDTLGYKFHRKIKMNYDKKYFYQ